MTERLAPSKLEPRICSWLIFLLPALALTTGIGITIIEVAILLGAIAYARPLWSQRERLFYPARFIVFAFAFNFAIAVISLMWSGFQANFLESPVKQLLVVASIGLVVLIRPAAELFWYGLFVGTIGAACLAFYQRFELNMARAEGFHMIIMFGDIAIAMGLMSLASIQRFAKTRLAILPYIAFLAGLFASILSASRGGWIALLCSFIPLYSYGNQAMRRKVVSIAAASAVLFTAACFIPQLGVGQRLADVSNDIHQYRIGNVYTPVGTRLEMWKGAWKMFAEHPLTGVGRANYNQGLNELIVRGELSPTVHDFYHAHSEMLNALATQGVAGILALLFVYGAPLIFFMRHLRRDDDSRPYALAGLLLVVSFIDFGLTQVLFAHHIGAAFYAVTVSVLAGICIMTQRDKPFVGPG